MKNSNHPLDDLFKNGLSDFEQAPEPMFWDQLEHQLEPSPLDAAVKARLAENEVTPSPKVWHEVQKGLPLNLYVKSGLKWLSRVAAVLVLVMAATLYFTKIDNSPVDIVEEKNLIDIKTETPLLEATIEEAIVETEVSEEEIKTLPKRKPKVRKVPNPVAEREFNIDEEKIKAILQPLEVLPIDAAVAFNPNKKKVQKTGASENEETIFSSYPPLKVVESHEIEELIKSYDKQNKAKDPNN